LLGPPSMWSGRAAAVLAHGTGSIADSVVERWFTPEFRSTNAVRVQPLRDMLVASSDAGYAACCGALERMNLEPDLGGVRAPTLAVAAADDRATPPDHLFRIAAAITGCRVAVVPRAAHLANVEQPETVTDLILAHLLDGGPGNARSEEEP
jgi:3-oxoadipate enol-lactonase